MSYYVLLFTLHRLIADTVKYEIVSTKVLKTAATFLRNINLHNV